MYRPELPSTPIPALIQSSISSSSSLQHGIETHTSLTQPRPYLASRTPRNPHADAHRAPAFLRSAFLKQSASTLPYPYFHGIVTSTSLGHRWLSVGNDADAMESHHRVAYDTTPSQVFSSLGGFAVRTDWRISGPKHCETTSDFSPSSSPMSMLTLNWSSSAVVAISEERKRRGAARVEFSFVSGTEGVRRRSRWSR